MASRCTDGWAVGLAAFACGLVSFPASASEFENATPISTVLFGSLEAGPAKTFAAIGLKRALGGSGLDASGFRLLVKLGGAREQANRSPPHGTAWKVEAQTLLGYEWRLGETFLSLYAGTDYEGEQRPCVCGVVTTARYGQRLQVDLWATPLHEMMLQASAYASTLDRRVWGRVAPGWTFRGVLPDGAYLGPEIEIYRQRGYRKLRLGLHLTGIRLFGLAWRLTGGWQHSSDRRGEAYATLGLHWRR